MSGLSVHMLIRKIDLLTLRLFLAAIEEKQIGRAAAVENIAASAATKRIQDLEDVIGLKLLERNRNGVVPSKAGEVLARRLRTLFASLEDMRRELSEFADGVRGQVRIAATTSAIVERLARELGEFASNFPLIDLDIREAMHPAVVKALLGGEVDLAIVVNASGLDYDAFELFPYRVDQYVAVFTRDHPFSEKASVNMSDLLEQRLIGMNPATTLMTSMREAASALGRELRPKFVVSGLDVALSLVRAGLGVTVQPESLVATSDRDELATAAIAEPWARRTMHLATPRDKPLTAASRLLMKYLVSQPEALLAESEHQADFVQ